MTRTWLSLALALTVAPPAWAEDAGMVSLAADCFTMGCSDKSCAGKDHLEAQKVCLDAFELDAKEVTVADYAKCVDAKGCKAIESSRGPSVCNTAIAGRDQHPVNCVTWDEAAAYCAWAGKRLPTEAEWEYAARGAAARNYPWGNDPPDCDRGVIGECKHTSTEPVGSRPKGDTETGISDLAGNVFEWVQDWHTPKRKASKKALTNPRGPCDGKATCKGKKHRVIKGGSFGSVRQLLPGWARYYAAPSQPGPAFGFRCAR